jgi:UPF0755 protein
VTRRQLVCAVAFIAAAGCTSPDGTARVVIPPGATMRQAAESLAQQGVIRVPSLFAWYASFTDRDRSIKPGTYLVNRRNSWNEVIDALVEGRGQVHVVTIPEGWDVRTMVPAIAEVMEVEPESLTAAMQDSSLLRRVGSATDNLEGYLFPETYLMPDGADARTIVRMLVTEFERRWMPEWNDRLIELGMTRNQVITLASIIEREARVAAERPVISAVYHNRLERGMRLQADPTIQFALGRRAGRVLYRDLEINSPYNTYRRTGLPPGPIASPGAASIEAALYPDDVPWLYFVAHPDGHHLFRATLREHNEAVRRMRALRQSAGSGRP